MNHKERQDLDAIMEIADALYRYTSSVSALDTSHLRNHATAIFDIADRMIEADDQRPSRRIRTFIRQRGDKPPS